jgi:hypothetical protein
LQSKIDDGVRARDESFNQHQLKLLDMVSEVLNENTQKVLESLIHHQFTDLVIPAIGEKAGRAVSDILRNELQPNITAAIQKEIQQSLSHSLSRSLRSNEFIHAISDRVGASVASSVQQEVLTTLTQRLTPTMSNIATQSAQHVASELHQQFHEQFERMKAQRAADSGKIDQLMGRASVKGLTVVPLRLYITDKGRAKLELGLARGKQLHDRRRDIAERQSRRDVERELADATRGRS